MDVNELRAKSIEDLNEQLRSLEKDLFAHRMQQSTGQLTQTHLLKQVSKDIARVKTFLNQKSRQIELKEA